MIDVGLRDSIRLRHFSLHVSDPRVTYGHISINFWIRCGLLNPGSLPGVILEPRARTKLSIFGCGQISYQKNSNKFLEPERKDRAKTLGLPRLNPQYHINSFF